MSETLRAFIALDLPEEAKDFLMRFVEKQKVLYPEGKWVRKEHFHITLAFFPALPADHVESIRGILEDLGALFPPYRVLLGEVGTFPSWQRARVLWIGFNEDGKRKTKSLVEAILPKLQAIGIPLEKEREFIPHVTLARFRMPVRLNRIAFSEWSPFPVIIGEIALFESILKPSGPVYQKLVCVPLKGVRE